MTEKSSYLLNDFKNSMKFLGKMRLMIILRVSKNQGFTLSLSRRYIFEKNQSGIKLTPLPPPSCFRVKGEILCSFIVIFEKLPSETLFAAKLQAYSVQNFRIANSFTDFFSRSYFSGITILRNSSEKLFP